MTISSFLCICGQLYINPCKNSTVSVSFTQDTNQLQHCFLCSSLDANKSIFFCSPRPSLLISFLCLPVRIKLSFYCYKFGSNIPSQIDRRTFYGNLLNNEQLIIAYFDHPPVTRSVSVRCSALTTSQLKKFKVVHTAAMLDARH